MIMTSIMRGSKLDFDNRIEELKKINNEILKENEVLRNEFAELQTYIDQKEGKRITANRQLLLIHYLDLIDNLEFTSKEKKYNLIYFIIDKNRQAVKNFFNFREQSEKEQYKKIFNEKDLYFVLQLLNEVGLSEKAKKVDSDIIKLKF